MNVPKGTLKAERKLVLFYSGVVEWQLIRIKSYNLKGKNASVGDSGGSSGVMPCGGQLFVSYRKLDESYFSNVIEYSIQEGLYLCNVSFLNSSEYRSNSYQCYILI